MRIETETSPEGMEFTAGKAATMVLRLSACHILAKAIVDWNSLVKETLLGVPSLLQSYMSEVTRQDWNQHPWASKVIAYMWVFFDRQVATFDERKALTKDLG